MEDCLAMAPMATFVKAEDAMLGSTRFRSKCGFLASVVSVRTRLLAFKTVKEQIPTSKAKPRSAKSANSKSTARNKTPIKTKSPSRVSKAVKSTAHKYKVKPHFILRFLYWNAMAAVLYQPNGIRYLKPLPSGLG